MTFSQGLRPRINFLSCWSSFGVVQDVGPSLELGHGAGPHMVTKCMMVSPDHCPSSLSFLRISEGVGGRVEVGLGLRVAEYLQFYFTEGVLEHTSLCFPTYYFRYLSTKGSFESLLISFFFFFFFCGWEVSHPESCRV